MLCYYEIISISLQWEYHNILYIFILSPHFFDKNSGHCIFIGYSLEVTMTNQSKRKWKYKIYIIIHFKTMLCYYEIISISLQWEYHNILYIFILSPHFFDKNSGHCIFIGYSLEVTMTNQSKRKWKYKIYIIIHFKTMLCYYEIISISLQWEYHNILYIFILSPHFFDKNSGHCIFIGYSLIATESRPYIYISDFPDGWVGVWWRFVEPRSTFISYRPSDKLPSFT